MSNPPDPRQGVKLLRPKIALGRLIREPGGLTVAEALSAAQNNLDTLAVPADEALAAALNDAEAKFAAYPAQPSDADLDGLYRTLNAAVGLGALVRKPAVDAALLALCALLDQFKLRPFDREGVAVCLRALRLLIIGNPSEMEIEAVMVGLRRIGAHYDIGDDLNPPTTGG